jgi:hypothetical protein
VEGDQIELGIPLAKLDVFDVESEQALEAAAA